MLEALDIIKIEKNNSEIKNSTLEIFAIFLFLDFDKKSVINLMSGDIFSISNPIKKEDIVVAMLLPKIIPILWLKLRRLALISAIVNIMVAELD